MKYNHGRFINKSIYKDSIVFDFYISNQFLKTRVNQQLKKKIHFLILKI